MASFLFCNHILISRIGELYTILMDQLENTEWLKQKYIDESLSMSQIGKLIGVTKHPVYRALKKHGIQARLHSSKYPHLNDKEWLRHQYLDNQKSVKQIAKEINATVGTVHSALTHMGIKTRSPKESIALKNSIIASKSKINLPQSQYNYDKLPHKTDQKGVSAGMKRPIDDIIKEMTGIKLDIGCGKQKQPGFVGIDYRDWGNVDIVHDLEQTPWPLPDNCVMTAVASHVLEHINPHNGVFIDVMDEIWRVVRPGGQFALVVPYAGSPGFWQDPTHCNGITEATLLYFDPDPEGKYAGKQYYQFYEPKPWKIEKLAFNTNGNLECVLQKRRDDKSFHQDLIDDVVQEASSHAKTEPVKKYFSDKY